LQPDILNPTQKRAISTAILTITGSDGTGFSGVQADIRYIHELGGQAVSAVASITVQTTLGIQQFYDLPATIVRQQVEAIVNDLQPQVVNDWTLAPRRRGRGRGRRTAALQAASRGLLTGAALG
jgi:hypothetical protein